MKLDQVSLLLLISVVSSAQVRSGLLLPKERTISVRVTDAEGRPIQQAFIEPVGSFSFEAVTDTDGQFRTTTQAPAFVVRKYGYDSYFVRTEDATEFDVVLHRTAVKPTIRRCPAETDCSPFVGSFCFQTMEDVTPSKMIQDHDYVARYYVLEGTSENSAIMHGQGYNWSHGLPPGANVYRSIEYEETVFYRKLMTPPVADDWGISEMVWDARGTTQEGKYWRHLGMLMESASYSDVTERDAQMLDRVLDSVCFWPGY